MKIAKSRIGKNENAEGAFFSIYTSVLSSLKMLSVICPFASEHVYQKFFAKHEGAESIVLLDIGTFNEGEINTALEKRMEMAMDIITNSLEARQRTKIKLRWPVRQIIIQSPSSEAKATVAELQGILKSLLNSKEVVALDAAPEGDYECEEFQGGKVFVSRTLDEELYAEGIYNEVKRRVQQARKELALVEKDSIALTLDLEKEMEAIVRKFEDSLARETNSSSITYSPLADSESKAVEIDGRVARIRARKHEAH